MTVHKEQVSLRSYAKINLTLDILQRRDDGYHDIRSIMQTITLHDVLTVRLGGDGIRCRCDRGDIPTGEDNLAVAAARVFADRIGYLGGMEISIEKHIPVGAGLGGGSSNAAATLRALRTILCPAMPDTELQRMAAMVGSDVPFFIRGGTALAEGRGERLTQLQRAPSMPLVICKPSFSNSTAALYAAADEVSFTSRPNVSAMCDAMEHDDLAGIYRNVRNVFEDILPPEKQEIFAIRDRLRVHGAHAAAMTGSGSAVFGLFSSTARARSAYLAMRECYPETFSANFV